MSTKKSVYLSYTYVVISNILTIIAIIYHDTIIIKIYIFHHHVTSYNPCKKAKVTKKLPLQNVYFLPHRIALS